MNDRPAADRLRERNPLPEGTLAVGAGLLVAGLSAYGFLALSARALGTTRYAGLSALWSLVFLVAPGCFLSLEQEVARALSARRARDQGGGPLVRRAMAAGAGLTAILVLATFAAWGPLTEHLFDGESLLLLSFAGSLLGYAAHHLARGTLSGNGRFPRYGVMLASDGLLRLVGCAVLFVAGVDTPGAYGALVALAPCLSVPIALRGQRGLATPGPQAPWSELSTALGWLLAGSLLAQVMVNGGLVAVKVLASDAEQEVASRFFAALLIARVPLFLFQAVQAALLPKLAGLAAAGARDEFRSGLGRLLGAVGVIGVLGTIGGTVLGPTVVEVLYGADFRLGARHLGMLAGASAVLMVAMALAQSLIALAAYSRAVIGWATGVTVFATVTMLTSGVLERVEYGFLAGAAAAAVVHAALLATALGPAFAPGPHERSVVADDPSPTVVT